MSPALRPAVSGAAPLAVAVLTFAGTTGAARTSYCQPDTSAYGDSDCAVE